MLELLAEELFCVVLRLCVFGLDFLFLYLAPSGSWRASDLTTAAARVDWRVTGIVPVDVPYKAARCDSKLECLTLASTKCQLKRNTTMNHEGYEGERKLSEESLARDSL